jgi:hypothetical protein
MIIFVNDMFVEDYAGGGELTTEAIIKSSYIPITKIRSSQITLDLMKQHSDKFWIFGNFAGLKDDRIIYAIKNLNYSVLEYDYKYCIYRSPEKHEATTGSCNCHKESRGKLVSVFYKKAKALWFMSEKQKSIYCEHFTFLDNDNTRVLSSVFYDDTLEILENLDCSDKTGKWIVLNSDSWVKGKSNAIMKAEELGLDYELVWGLKYEELLRKMARSKGIVYVPPGGDTCPRMVIEAKILGCKLILNDNVQHKDEEWFFNRKSILEYMKNRTKVFWSTIENLWNLETPEYYASSEETKFNFIVPFYNAESFLDKCIKSIQHQNYKNFRCYLIDDMSTDNSNLVINKNIENDDRFNLIVNKEKKYALGNIVGTLIDNTFEPDEVNILLDGDDWLPCGNVLSYLNRTYTDQDCLMTYGSYIYYPHGNKGIEPSRYPDEIIDSNSFRDDKWRASHLRTFKTKVWNQINLEDLKDQTGDFYHVAYDQALMLPLLEICGHKSVYISDIMHVYNRTNPLNVDKVKQQKQYKTSIEIRNKKPYERIF